MLLVVVVVVGALTLALRFPAVQTKVAQKAARLLSNTIHHQVTIDSVDIKFFKRVVLHNVRVLDRQKKTLFYIGQAEADISFFSLFRKEETELTLPGGSKLTIPLPKFPPNKLHIASLTLTRPEANLIQYKGSDSLNLSTFIASLSNLITTDTAQSQNPFEFKIDEIVLKNGHFSYHDYNEPTTAHGLDYQHMDLQRINGRFSEINIIGDTIQTVITSLTTIDKNSQTYLKDLDTRMTFSPKFWEWDELNLRVNNSHLAKYVRFDYERFMNFKEFNDSMNVTATFDSTYITSEDVALFATVLKDWDEKVLISGKVKGKVKNFRAQDIDLRYGQYTHITGDISADGLPNFKNTFADLVLGPSTINARDLKHFLPAKAYAMAARAGTVHLEGEFTGFYNDFVANGSFKSALGNVVSDINLKFDKNNIDRSAYRGYLKTSGFDVGGLLGDRSVIKRVAMDGRVQGSGFSLATAHLNLDATINAINLKNYNYRNIVVNADLSRQKFNGDIRINDPNLKMTASGQINLQNNRQVFDLRTNISSARLHALGLTDQPIVLSTQADVDFTGIELDKIVGLAEFRKTTLSYAGRQVNIDSLTIESHFHDGIRELHVGSELLALQAGGNFLYSTFFRDLQTLYEEYRLNLENNPLKIQNYYRRKASAPPASYEVDLDVHLRQVNPLLQAFLPQVSISDFSTMEGTFRNGPTAVLTLVGKMDTIRYGNNEFYKNHLEVTSSKLWNTPDVLANAIITSERQKLGSAGDTEKLYIEGVWDERLIHFSSNIAQTGTTNRANISGNIAFEQDQIQIVFNRSNINVLDKVWTISPNNTISVQDGALQFENVTFSNGPQSVSIFGVLSKNPQDVLSVNLSNFRLENLNPILPDEIDGLLNGELQVRDLYSEVHLSSRLAVDTFMIGGQLIGNVAGTTSWDSQQGRMNVDLGISRDAKKVLSLTGTYNPKGGEDQELDLLAVLDNAQLKLVEPVLKTIMSDLGGTMDGRVRISGRLSGPILKGSVMVSDGSFIFNYLNTRYTFSDRVFFTENDISFQNVRIRDIYNNTAVLNGGIYHNGFQNMVLDLRARFNKFMVLNTTRADNPLYYGTAFATGEVTALGATSNLQVNITARSENNTNISIPLDNTSSLERQNFISFVNNNPAKQDSAGAGTPVVQKSVDLSGIRLNFNLEVNENAYIELIFDQRSGDIIRGRGRGNIRMEIDTRGEFAMYGNYEIVQGRYNFTLLGVINKEFNVRPGGTVTFNGDPLDGLLKITATYTQRVSLAPILGDLSEQDQQSAAARSRYPVTAVMDLDGPLTTPQIRLNLEFNDTPSLLESQVTRYLNNIRNDEQELNRQVFSLLAFKRLSAQDEFQVGLGVGDLGSSVGELFSNQLSYWLSQIDTNLEVDIGVSGYGDQVLDDVQLKLSYTFLEGRLKVTREGSVNNNRLGNNRSTAAGDWSVEYYLSQSGQLRLRATYETTPRDFEATATASRQTISILHQANFDSFGELFRRRNLSKRAQRAAERERMIKLEDDTPTPRQNF
ncbi:translocation/assembly module TamB domain-containing protein [Rufibacter glacialis]|uniref:Translocation/assembly module TamB domain-containing protein n=1 Tax=Rufibacter glacialis TaxID=1259555 RepID=A0A5M8QH82_9BACT|nr:translocation/assembly module TamB domain-containing protein [Rufibacter glacialis]KAA6434578.1 hypothetical protein FOE74_10360 [Rufibacter glacialis]GGK70766.1 DUF490 domain-containing protein [Rufibacter glacialis]